MSPVLQRLSKEKDFKKINALGKSFFSPLFRLKVLSNKSQLSRFAVVVTTKTSKKATVRNRIKRQIKEIVRLEGRNIKAGADFIIMVKSPALGKDYQDLEKDLLSLFTKARLFS